MPACNNRIFGVLEEAIEHPSNRDADVMIVVVVCILVVSLRSSQYAIIESMAPSAIVLIVNPSRPQLRETPSCGRLRLHN